MQYHLFTIIERNGDFENVTYYLIVDETGVGVDPEEHGHRFAQRHRGSSESDWDELDQAYWADTALVRYDDHKEIPAEHGEVLKYYHYTEYV